MCTNFVPTRNADWARQTLGVELPPDLPAEAYPGSPAPLVVRGRQSGRLVCGPARFGLIPAWARDEKIARHTYNARSETAALKPSFRSAWRERRYGLLLLDHFFEPHYGSGRPVRWKIAQANGEPFGIACLWERWFEPNTQTPVVSFAMLTVNADAHPVMQQFHPAGDEKRTPLVLWPEQHPAWLAADPAQAAAMMTADRMPPLQAEPAPRA